MQKQNNDNNRVRITMLLDDKTLSAIRKFGYEQFGSTNISKATMSMVEKYERMETESKSKE